MRVWLSLAVLLLASPWAIAPPSAAAQSDEAPRRARVQAVAPRPVGVYNGVEAGEAQPPPAYRRVLRRQGRRRARQILTWPGFTPLGDGSSRFFVQTTEPIQAEVSAEPGRVVVRFPRTTIHLTNSRRWLETRFFNTPVLRARLERRGRDMALVMRLRGQLSVQPRVRSEAAPGSNFHYVYIDFPPGDYAPVVGSLPGTGAVRASGPPERPDPRRGEPPPAPARELDPSLNAMDDERPPALR